MFDPKEPKSIPFSRDPRIASPPWYGKTGGGPEGHTARIINAGLN